jgi:hypothetical protein
MTHHNSAKTSHPNHNFDIFVTGLVKKIPWSASEKAAIFSKLKGNVCKGEVPGKKSCQDCIDSSNGALGKRSWKAVKYFFVDLSKISVVFQERLW